MRRWAGAAKRKPSTDEDEWGRTREARADQVRPSRQGSRRHLHLARGGRRRGKPSPPRRRRGRGRSETRRRAPRASPPRGRCYRRRRRRPPRDRVWALGVPAIIGFMPSILCPFCLNRSHASIQWGRVFENGRRIRIAATCDHCGSLSSAEGPVSLSMSETTHPDNISSALAGREKELEWWPKVGVSPEVEDVPPSIARAAREAYSSASVGNFMAAILMARTVVEATAKANEIATGTLASKINQMKDRSLIRPAIAEQAHEVRFMGNDMAHGDIDAAPDAIDAEEILALMGEVLTEVFQGPARLARIRARRTERG